MSVFLQSLRDFAASEAGVISVEWVMMIAGGVALGLSAIAVVSGGMEDLSGELQGSLVAINPGEAGFMPFQSGSPDLIED